MKAFDFDEVTDLDSIVGMLKMAFSLEEWEQMIQIADQLHTQAHRVYEQQQLELTKGGQPRTLHIKRPLVYYLGFSQLTKGIAFQKQGKYESSRECVEKYAELGWVEGLNEEGLQEVEDYRTLAKANTYTLDLLQGKEEVLPNYVRFLHENSSEELLPGMITILESTIVHNYNINGILREFKTRLTELGTFYEEPENIRYYVTYLYLLAVYRFIEEKYTVAIEVTLNALESADKKCVALFESFRSYANKYQKKKYKFIQKNVLERELKNEKNLLYDGYRIRIV
ncbi:DNA-binding protein [Paenibacillus brasilensis]|uniref:Tetratricopeptide (TPR) repeat protein n=1 Tax=Paenibacillus brasilensis TaxID=128574 RepID=A0ABU0KTU7_9BACL|nr:DNA-binding protein [Paenibacillus brasilensis]MDQ0492857.1 tetratricopeptide (TPR) repeat protein [Paenibacillus brasilensis]